jgi:uncharacterized RDD family membrane protein YckC
MTWYLLRGERQVGPMSEQTLRAMAATGQIGPDALVRRDESQPWGVLAAIPDIFGPGTEPFARETADKAAGAASFAPPWRRFWARLFDVLLSASLIMFAVGLARPSLYRPGGAFFGHEQLLGWLIIPVAMLVDALIYAVFGNTAGKAIAGIRVVNDRSRERLVLPGYVKRNLELYFFGLGTGLPVVSLVTMFFAYRRVDREETPSWDLSADSQVISLSANSLRTWIIACIYVLLVAMLTLSRLHGGALRHST